MKRLSLIVTLLIGATFSFSGCSKGFYGGAATGAAGAGAAYEYQSHKAMKNLEKERDEGRISQEEFERRSDEIKDRSLIQ